MPESDFAGFVAALKARVMDLRVCWAIELVCQERMERRRGLKVDPSHEIGRYRIVIRK